jgi:transposase
LVQVARNNLDAHVAAALDPLGRLVGTESFKADAVGYKALLAWLETFGQVTMIGVEGTGSYGVGLARFLRRQGIKVVEVDRPNRQVRRTKVSPILSTLSRLPGQP